MLGHFPLKPMSNFNIAFLKVSMLMNLILSAISVIAGTKIAELYAQNTKHDELNAIMGRPGSDSFRLFR